MEINRAQGGAALFAFKQALKIPEAMVNLVRGSGDVSSLASTPLNLAPAAELAGSKSKGGLIDLLV